MAAQNPGFDQGDNDRRILESLEFKGDERINASADVLDRVQKLVNNGKLSKPHGDKIIDSLVNGRMTPEGAQSSISALTHEKPWLIINPLVDTPYPDVKTLYEPHVTPNWCDFDENLAPHKGWVLFTANIGFIALSAAGLFPVVVETAAWIPKAQLENYPEYTALTPLGIGIAAIAEGVRRYINKHDR